MLLDLWPWRASSGVRRLQAYQLQEEALLKDAIKKTVEKVLSIEGSSEQEQGQAAPERSRKAAKRKPAVVAREEYPEVRFKRNPIYTQPTPVNPTLPAWLTLISLEVDQWYLRAIPLWAERKGFLLLKQSAANDAEYRIRFLLLTA